MPNKQPPKAPEALARWMRMADLYKDGLTLEEISLQFGVSKQRIWKCLSIMGITKGDGGCYQRSLKNEAEKNRKRDARYLRRHGCNYQQYLSLRGRATLLYCTQRTNAAHRGVEWRFNFWEWWQVWEKSGKWKLRGRGQGWVMCRIGDVGPYAPDNVFIAPARINTSETSRKKSGLPIGVTKSGKSWSFTAFRQINGKRYRQSGFDTPEDAHATYLRWGGE